MLKSIIYMTILNSSAPYIAGAATIAYCNILHISKACGLAPKVLSYWALDMSILQAYHNIHVFKKWKKKEVDPSLMQAAQLSWHHSIAKVCSSDTWGNFVQWHLHVHLQCLWKFTLDVGFVPYESSRCNRWSTGFSFSINVRIQSNRGLGSPSWTSWRWNRKCGLRFRHYGMVTHRNTSPQLEKNNHRLKISNLGAFSNQNQPLTFKRR